MSRAPRFGLQLLIGRLQLLVGAAQFLERGPVLLGDRSQLRAQVGALGLELRDQTVVPHGRGGRRVRRSFLPDMRFAAKGLYF